MTPEYVTFQHEGKECQQVSFAYKLSVLKGYAEKYKCKTFVETGTYLGDTIAEMRHLVEQVYSIEINPAYYARACKRFDGCANVHLFWGDSKKELPRLMPLFQEPVLFWLDAHLEGWAGPVREELAAILDSGIKGVTLIDDMDFLPDAPNLPSEHGIARIIHVG